MSALRAIAWREVGAYYRVPLGWVVTALYLLLAGVVFGFFVLQPAEPASLRPFFSFSHWLLVFVAPAVSMRLFAEEQRTGSLDGLRSAPVSDWIIVLGKYAGAAIFMLTMLAPTLLYLIVLESVANPDYGPILSGFLGMTLVAMLYLSVGMLASSLTSNQTVAFLSTLFALVLWQLATTSGAAALGPPYDGALYALSIDLRLESFSKGVLDTGDIVTLLVVSVWCVVLTGVGLESRRWRR
ncbi:MAG: ABC transporter permease [Phycisphaerales bacterium JB043]